MTPDPREPETVPDAPGYGDQGPAGGGRDEEPKAGNVQSEEKEGETFSH